MYKVTYTLDGCLLVSGPKPEVHSVLVAHSMIEKRIGMNIPVAKVTAILSTLGMQVSVQQENEEHLYKVEIPTFRSSKDVRRKEDVIEEIARIIGYDSITPILPQCAQIPHLHTALYNARKIKAYVAHTMKLSEVENYTLFDNSFIKKIGYELENELVLRNPLTEERTTLVTSLIPHLLQNVLLAYEHHEQLGFFEWARIFHKKNQAIEEQKVLAGIVYNKKILDFYDIKHQLETMCATIGRTVVWKENKKKPWWAASYKVIDAYVDNHYIGTMAQLSEQLTSHFTKGQVICFEFYLESLLSVKSQVAKARPLSTHQLQSLDVSFMIHQSVTTEKVASLIRNVDDSITNALLIDSYHKPEWKERKSMTFRCMIYGTDGVLSKEDLEEMLHHIKTTLEGYGAEVR